MKKKMKILFLALLLIVSLIVILYPLIANYLSEKNRSLIETQYTEAIKQMDTSALDAARAAAGAYNETLLTVPDKPFTKDALIKAPESYDALLNVREDGIMGYVEIPAIGVNAENNLLAVSEKFDDMLEWAAMYNNADIAAKKMIVSRIIDRVDMYRDYEIKITLNISIEQFLNSIEMVA